MSARRELRVAGQAEPISHFTDAVEAGGFLFVSGIVPVDEQRELVGGDDVVAQARCVFENMRAVLAAGGCTFADVVKVTVYLTDVSDRPLVNPVRQEVFGETRPGIDPRRDLGSRDPGGEDRGRVRGAGAVVGRNPGESLDGSPDDRLKPVAADPYNAAITWLEEPLRGAADGPLAGRTLLVKDLIDTAGVRTTYGSRIYADHVPDVHASVVQRALDAGAVVVGKANLPEFAWSVLGQNPWYGTVHNPAHPGKTTGGSSAGNAAALAAGLVELGLGTDTGCSIRLPSAACGTVGLKSQWGLLPLDGIFPLCPSLDTVGPMGRTVEDVALLWSVLSGRPVPEPAARRASPSVCCGRRPTSATVARPRRATRPSSGSSGLEHLGARVVEAVDSGCAVPTCGRSSCTRRPRATAATFPVPGRRVRRRNADRSSRRPRCVTPEAVARRLRCARGLAHLRAGRRPLRQPLLRGRASRRRTPTSST